MRGRLPLPELAKEEGETLEHWSDVVVLVRRTTRLGHTCELFVNVSRGGFLPPPLSLSSLRRTVTSTGGQGFQLSSLKQALKQYYY